MRSRRCGQGDGDPTNQEGDRMKKPNGLLTGLIPLLLASSGLQAQQAEPDTNLQEVVVTGSRIIQTSANSQQPLSIIDRSAIERTGLASIGELLQQVTAGGKALNAEIQLLGQLRLSSRRRRHWCRLRAGRPAQPRLQARAGAGRRHPLGERVVRLRRLRRRGPQHHPDEHHRSHRSAGRRRVGHLRLGRHRRRGQHHHAQEFRGRRAQRVSRRIRDWAARPPTPASRLAAAASASPDCSSPATTSRKKSARVSGSSPLSRSHVAGLAAGSSGIPQGRYTFCDPARPTASLRRVQRRQDTFYDLRSTTARRRRCGIRRIPPRVRTMTSGRRSVQLRALQPAADAVEAQVHVRAHGLRTSPTA